MIPAALVGWAVEALVASTLLMLLVMAVRGHARRLFGPGVAYALWLLPVTRLLLPPLPGAWRDAVAAPIARVNERVTILIVEPLGLAPAAHAAPDGFSVASVVLALWAAGAAAFIGWHIWSHRRFCQRMLASAAAITEGRVRVISSAAASGPLAFGIWRKYVAFPNDFDARYDADERALALAHELTHHARGDLIANWAALVVLALHWFNPVAWRAFRAFRADQEMACDAWVLAHQGRGCAHAYGRAIVKSAHGRAVSAACHMHTVSDLKGRLRMLSSDRTSRRRLIGGTTTVAIALVVGLGATASGTRAADTLRGGVGTVIGVDLTPVPPAPQAPATPAAPAAAQAPAAPEAPEVAEAPDVPETPDVATKSRKVIIMRHGKGNAPVVVTEDWSGDRRSIRRVIRTKDGKLVTDDVNGTVFASIPEISSKNCSDGAGDPQQTVLHDEKNGRRIIILCTNRIERMAKKAAEVAANSAEIERNAYRSALNGLRAQRSQMAANRALAEESRALALKAVDEAIAELESDLAKAN